MKGMPSLLLASYLVLPQASAEIVKCRDEHGFDKYQNFPCAIDSIGSTATVAAAKRAAAVSAAMSDDHAPQLGMAMNVVRNAWGAPKATKVIKGMETWYYNGPGKTWQAVHFDTTGNVRFVSHSPPPPQHDQD